MSRSWPHFLQCEGHQDFISSTPHSVMVTCDLSGRTYVLFQISPRITINLIISILGLVAICGHVGCYIIWPIKYTHSFIVLSCCGDSIIVILCGVVCHYCLPISFRVTSLALGQSCDCPSANEATLKDMGLNQPLPHHINANTAKDKLCA